MEKDWSLFGWRGISFEMPQDWNPGLLEEKRKKGYLRVDDAYITRLELEWRNIKGVFSLQGLIERYLSALKKRAKSARLDLHIERNIKFAPLKERQGEYFYWRADYQSWNLISFCSKCRCLLLVRILARLNEKNIGEKAKRIYETLRDHSPAEYNRWAIYGLNCEIPQDFLLHTYSLKAGHITLEFKRKKENLHIECISLANVLLAEKNLKDWYLDFHRDHLKGFNYQCASWQACGHAGVKISGEKKFWSLKKTKGNNLQIGLWHCAESNKIFLLRLLAKAKQTSLIEQISGRVYCHGEETV